MLYRTTTTTTPSSTVLHGLTVSTALSAPRQWNNCLITLRPNNSSHRLCSHWLFELWLPSAHKHTYALAVPISKRLLMFVCSILSNSQAHVLNTAAAIFVWHSILNADFGEVCVILFEHIYIS